MMRWSALSAVVVLALVGCAGSIHRESEVRRAFAAQGYELRSSVRNGPLMLKGGLSDNSFWVIIFGSADEAERKFAPLAYDVRERNVIVTAEKRPSPEHVLRIEAALEDLRSG